MSQPSQKQLFFVLKNRTHLMDDEQKDVLWTAYQNARDHNKEFGPLEEEMWETFLSAERLEKGETREADRQTKEKIKDLTLTKRMDDLEETVELLQETLRILIEQQPK